jgi:three-Cys-motif partner protein
VSEVHYRWGRIGEAYPSIKQHSVAKHEILHAYLTGYIQTLVSNPNREEFRLTLIDGFSGGGVYRHATSGEEVLGSPFVMLQAAKEAEYHINRNRHKKVALHIDFFFIEQDKGAAILLEHELKSRGYGSYLNENIFIRQSTFDLEANSIIEFVKRKSPRAARAIFLLDQYGYTRAPTSLVNKLIKQLPGGEVILTFAVDAFLNYVSDKSDVTRKLLEKIGTPDVLRGRTIEDIKSKEKDWRLFIQSCLYKDIVDACGARYYTPFFIRSNKGHGDYWLIHLSQRARARDVMARIHWEKNNYFIHYGGAGIEMFDMLGYLPERDDSFTGQTSLGFCFDEPAKDFSIAALAEQLPRLVYPDPDGMTFGELFSSTCNTTPASADIYRDALGRLIEYGEIEVVSQDGTKRRSATRIHDSDQVVPPRQQRLF